MEFVVHAKWYQQWLVPLRAPTSPKEPEPEQFLCDSTYCKGTSLQELNQVSLLNYNNIYFNQPADIYTLCTVDMLLGSNRTAASKAHTRSVWHCVQHPQVPKQFDLQRLLVN